MITKATSKKSKTTKRPQAPVSLPQWLRIVAQAAEAKAEQLQTQAGAGR